MNWKIVAFCLGLAASVGAVSAHADTVTFDGTTYTLSYTTHSAGVYDVYLTIDTSNYAGGSSIYQNYMDDVALQLAGSDNDYSSITVLSAPSGYSDAVVDGGLSGSGCNASGDGFFCLAYAGSGLGVEAGLGDVYQFEFQVDDSHPLGGQHGLYDNNNSNVEVNYQYENNRGVIKTNKDNTNITMSPAPEPSSLALLGTGLLGVGLLTKKMSGAA